MRAETFLIVAAVLVAVGAAAEDANSPQEMSAPEEDAERELQRKRNAEPVLVCVPAELRATVRPGETVAVPIKISNAGGKALRWAITAAPQWSRFDSRSGELRFGEARTQFVTLDATRLQEGPLEGTVVVEAGDARGSPASLRVDATVVPVPAAPTPGELARQGTLVPAGSWAVRVSRCEVDATVMLRDASLDYRDSPEQFVAEGQAVSGTYGTQLKTVDLQVEFGRSWSQASTYIPAQLKTIDYDISHTLLGVRAVYVTSKRVRPSISAGYALFEFTRNASWSGSSIAHVSDGQGSYLGVGLTYMLSHRVSLGAEWRRSSLDGDWSDDNLSHGAAEDRSTRLDLGVAVHF